ncbi:MAG TPA: heparan-alpha-glucosaminide N-acetyltransferase domain-containing protein [Phnomibacter sp.]|nr:heparan-alpha-glucosaminide N-acetyltransferase domain-containing protein [Phnomibacter sp.]
MAKERYYSLDVFRGATVALMILVNNPGSWQHIYGPLKHAPWHGCTPTDLVFPFFLFAVGNAMAFVLPGLQQAGAGVFWRKVLKRVALIFAIGLFLNWSPFVKWSGQELVFKHWTDPQDPTQGIRILGVLQRIALAYGLAAILAYFTRPRVTFYVCTLILLGYWALVYLANPADPYSLEGFIGTHWDIQVLGTAHVYKGEGVPFDPEGLLSTIPAVVQVVFGYFTGQYIQQKGKNYEMLAHLLLAGVILTLGGLIWDTSFPINKKIWSSSYVLYTTGLALFTLSTFIYLIEFKAARGAWSRFFDVFGKNPLFIFVLSGFLPRVVGLLRFTDGQTTSGQPKYTNAFGWFYEHICAPVSADPRNGSLLYAVAMIAFYWLLVWWMDKRKIYVKV